MTRTTGLAALAGIAVVLGWMTACPMAAVAQCSAPCDVAGQVAITAGTLSFATAPTVPNLGSVVLDGDPQTIDATMNPFAIDDATGSGSGWNVTVQGDSDSGYSPVFAEYCPGGACGTLGYVSAGATLPADSLTLDSTGASFVDPGGTSGVAPALTCDSGCSLDSAAPVTIATATPDTGMGTWSAEGWSSASLVLSTPATLGVLPANDVFQLDLTWSLASGP